MAKFSLAQEYFAKNETIRVSNSSRFAYGSAYKSIVVRAARRKSERLTRRIASLNREHLSYFIKLEDHFLHSLCKVPVYSEPEISRQNLEKIPTRHFYSDESILTQGTSSDSLAIDDWRITAENRANSLLDGAQCSFNRFENLCLREGSMIPKGYRRALQGSWDLASSTSDPLNELLASNRNELKHALLELESELKKSELITDYIKIRTEYLQQVAREVGMPSEVLNSLYGCGHYFTEGVNERMSIFSDKKIVEKLGDFLNLSPKANLNFPNTYVPTTSSNEPTIKLKDVLSKSLSDEISSENTPGDNVLENSQKLKDGLNETKGYSKHFPGVDSTRSSLDQSADSSRGLSSKQEKWKPNPLKTKRRIDRVQFTFDISPIKNKFQSERMIVMSMGFSFQASTKANLNLSVFSNYELPRIELKKSDAYAGSVTRMGRGGRVGFDYAILKQCRIKASLELTEVPTTLGFARSISKSAFIGVQLVKPSSSKRTVPTLDILYDLLHETNGQPAVVIRTGFTVKSKHSFKN